LNMRIQEKLLPSKKFIATESLMTDSAKLFLLLPNKDSTHVFIMKTVI